MNRIPTHDHIGQRVKVGEAATIFSPHGIHYEGKVIQVGGKRYLAVDGCRIGGLGNCFLMKG